MKTYADKVEKARSTS